MFHSARFKLTAWYLIIIMIISISFSAVIYRVSLNEVQRFDRLQRVRIEHDFGMPGPGTTLVIDNSLLEDIQRRIILNLVTINVGILAISGVTSYFLAGMTLKPIKEMMDEQNRFISDASHEIGTPLTSLKTAMEVYLREKKPSLNEASTLVKESITEVNKLQELSGSLLQLAQYHKPDNHTKIEIVSIKEIIEETVRKLSPLSSKKEIKIRTKTEDNNFPGNKYSLTELLVILLDNAIKYSPKETTIEIESRKSDGQIIISVKDSGIGIDEKDIPHIFERFYRVDDARSREAGGTGLGLAIARHIVDAHSGRIWVESAIGQGSRFHFSVPVAP